MSSPALATGTQIAGGHQERVLALRSCVDRVVFEEQVLQVELNLQFLESYRLRASCRERGIRMLAPSAVKSTSQRPGIPRWSLPADFNGE